MAPKSITIGWQAAEDLVVRARFGYKAVSPSTFVTRRLPDSMSHGVWIENGKDETVTANGGLVLLSKLKHGLGICMLVDWYLCGTSGAPAVFFLIGELTYNHFMGFKRLACQAA